MQLGFVSAILGDLSLEQVLAFAADEGFACVELMCWPPGKADRRYAGVTHLDVTDLTPERASHVRELLRLHGVSISGLGYYPNPLDAGHRTPASRIGHLMKVIHAAALLEVDVVNTFIGRDHTQRLAENLARVPELWLPVVKAAKAAGVRIGIEHCPMLFSDDEWPGGKNVASTPAVWRQLFRTFDEVAPGTVGLNFDPSHLVWQFIDCQRALQEFAVAACPRPREGRTDRPRPPLSGRRQRPRLACAEAAGSRRCEMGRVLRGALGRGLLGTGLR